HVLGVVALLALSVFVDRAEAGDAPEEALGVRPDPPGPVHDAVVEPDRRETAAEVVGCGHQVSLERPADVLRGDLGALADGRGADADVRDAVDLHHAIRAVAGAAVEAAPAVVLEAPGEDPA